MNTTINILGERLQGLMGDIHFISDFDKAFDSPEQLLEIGHHNIREYAKFETMEEERKERISNLMSNILSCGLQKEAVEKFGNSEIGSIRLLLQDNFDSQENQAFWDQLMSATKRGLLYCGLSEEQSQILMKYAYNKIPESIMDYLEELYSPVRLISRTEAPYINDILVDMMKEAENAD